VSDKLASPRDLFLQLLAEMLWVERMLVFEVLPSLRKQVQSESLAAAVEEHLAQTRDHVTRVEAAFRALQPGETPSRPGALASYDEAPRRADDDVDAVAQRAQIAAHIGAAGAGGDAPAGAREQPDELALHLRRQLARRRHDEGARLGAAGQLVGAGE